MMPNRKGKKTAGQRTAKRRRSIEPGDEVRVYSLNQKGHVVEMAGSKEAVVQLGIMKMKVSLDDLGAVESGDKR